MLRKFNTNRKPSDNLKLGGLTAFVAGMVNVASLMIFFAFTSNVTGHFAILAEEISKGNWYQAAIVFGWIFCFFFGSFISGFIIVHWGQTRRSFAHAVPLILEIVIFVSVGSYGLLYYKETLKETEIMVGVMLLSMGLQNGLTAAISNFSIKTTHLTGLTTDVGILSAMFTRKFYREKEELRQRFQLLLVIVTCYLSGGILAGAVYLQLQFEVFFFVAGVLLFIIVYDYRKLKKRAERRQLSVAVKRETMHRLLRMKENQRTRQRKSG